MGNFTIKAFYETDPEINAAVQESYHRHFNWKADRARVNFNPEQFIPGLDLEMMYLDMYWAAEGYIWEKIQLGIIDVDEIERDFSRLLDFWKFVYMRKETPTS